MFAFHRKALAGIGVTAAAVASTALFAAPAQAASAGAGATKVDCEFPADSFQSRARVSAPVAAATKAIEQAKSMRTGQGWSALQVPVATTVE